MVGEVRPSTAIEAAGALSEAAAAGQAVRILGAGTKLHWGRGGREPDIRLSTRGLDAIREHNAGDLTAVLEAGVPLARAQEKFAAAGQMLALDPWLGAGGRATVGGILATADCGPLSHRYGSPRDLVLGVTVVLADGTVAKSGGQVIKNVAGYDVAKLFCGSLGTLGLIASVNVRLHPLPEATVTARGQSGDPGLLARAAGALAAAPLELEALDVAWENGRGAILAQSGGASATTRAERVCGLMRDAGLESIEALADDREVWQAERFGQRSDDATVLRVAAVPSALEGVLRVAQNSAARLVGRAALGVSYLTVEAQAVARLVAELPLVAAWTVLDAPEPVPGAVDPWGQSIPENVLELMRRVKARFDPSGTCNPGVFVGGI
jgi:glycolate oxidase FAD binding subunit